MARQGLLRGQVVVRARLACLVAAGVTAVSPAPGRAGEHDLVLGLGASTQTGVGRGAGGGVGGVASLEWSAIPDRVSLELGGEATREAGRAAVSVGLLVEAPVPLGPRLELMVGLGPVLVHARGATVVGGELALEVMAFAGWLGCFAEASLERVGGASTAGFALGPLVAF